MNRLAVYRAMQNYRKSDQLWHDPQDGRYHVEVADSYYSKRRFFIHGAYLAEAWKTWARVWRTPLGDGNLYVPRFILD